MRVLATLSKLLLGASLTTSVLAAPKPIETYLERRLQSLDDDVKAEDATWEAFAAACGGGSSRRDLRKRSNNVMMGESDKMELYPIGLKTTGLLSCVGMVITGNKKDGIPFQILGHVAGSKGTIESQWQKFKGFYEGMGDTDKDSTAGYLSVPDYKKKYENGVTGFYDKHEDRRDL